MPIQKITTGVIESSQTLTTPTISGNLSLDSTGTTGVRVPSANTLTFHTAGTEDMRIDSSGQVGIGVTPGAKLDVYNSAAAAVGNEVLRLRYTTATSSATGDLNFTNGSGTTLNKISSICTSGSTVDLGFSVFNSSLTEAMRVTAAGNFQMNSGYGSVATAYGCRAWINFNGQGTPSIRASGNVSSITDNAEADYTVNFTTAMPDANYAVVYGGATDWRTIGADGQSNITTSGVRLLTRLPSNANLSEVDSVALAIFR
jgi:uncharacterized protein YaiE (UPF0345 family)